jgi:unsaturated rhamnogalacturonyl hydrolase
MMVPLSLLLPFAVPAAGDEFSPDSIISITKRVAEYHMKYGYNNYPNSWDGGAYMTGIMAMHRLTGDAKYLDFARQWAIKFKWMPCVTVFTTSADDICCVQTYCEIYLLDPRPANDSMVANARANLENLFYKVKQRGIWSWDDALYMAPPAVSRYCAAIKNIEFLDSLDRYWWTTSANLYDTSYHLWYRDGGFKSQKAANGQPVFWSCGVAWVMGGITRVLQDMPAAHPRRQAFETQFREMAAAIKAEQGNNALYGGLWTTSMRDHNQFPDPESSASAFFCFGLTWGINNHILDSAQYIGCVKKAWKDLVANVGTDGRLRRCQNVDFKPAGIDPNNSSVEGEAAFMLAGEQLWKMAAQPSTVAKTPHPDNRSYRNGQIFRLIGGCTPCLPVTYSAGRMIEVFDVTGKRLQSRSDRVNAVTQRLDGNRIYIVRYLERKD